MNEPPTIKMLRIWDVTSATGLSRSSVWLHVKLLQLPPPVKIGTRAVGWSSAEIGRINEARMAGASEDEIKDLVQSMVAGRRRSDS